MIISNLLLELEFLYVFEFIYFNKKSGGLLIKYPPDFYFRFKYYIVLILNIS